MAGLHLDRRRFLKGTAGLSLATAAVTLGGACSRSLPPTPPDLRVFSAQHVATLVALAEIVLAGAPGLETVDLTDLVRDVDAAFFAEDEVLRAKFKDALLFVEWTPQFSLKFRPFSALEPADRTTLWARFAESPLKIKRTVYQGLTGVITFAYADRESVWPHLGYSGPWVGATPPAGAPQVATESTP